MENIKPELVLSVAQFVIILVGAIWAYFRIWKEGIHNPRIQFEIECQPFEVHKGEIPIEFRIILKNKGLIKHKFYNIQLRIRGIKENEDLDNWKGNEPRLLFPHKLIDTEVIFKRKFNYVFVEPGVEQVLNYNVKLSASQKLISVRAEFQYDERKNHSIERVFQLKTNN